MDSLDLDLTAVSPSVTAAEADKESAVAEASRVPEEHGAHKGPAADSAVPFIVAAGSHPLANTEVKVSATPFQEEGPGALNFGEPGGGESEFRV